MGKNESNVVNKQDPFGTERFNAIKEQFGDPAKLNKLFRGRFENIVSVFSYRTSVEHELFHTEKDRYPNHDRYLIQERLSKFKSIEFFLAAFQSLLDEKRKHDAKVPVKKKRTYGW